MIRVTDVLLVNVVIRPAAPQTSIEPPMRKGFRKFTCFIANAVIDVVKQIETRYGIVRKPLAVAERP